MTLSDVIALVDEIKPNAFSPEAKTAWINEVEGLVQTEVWLTAVEEVVHYDYTVDAGAELLVHTPHDKIYWAYLSAMIDFAQGEYNKYQNDIQVFNHWYREYMRWYAMRYRPADQNEEPWQGYYFTAYGIAVKHGFSGSEKEWLATLTGPPGTLDPEEVAAEVEKQLVLAQEDGRFIGVTPELSIGKVETLPAGSNATATLSGTKEKPILDLGLPQGADAQGEDVFHIYRDDELDDTILAVLGQLAYFSSRSVYIDVQVDGLGLGYGVWHLNIRKCGPGYGVVEAITYNTEESYRTIAPLMMQRNWYGYLSKWAWVNPPLKVGIEYLTTELWMGKGVYTKVIDCGSALEDHFVGFNISGLGYETVIGCRGCVGNAPIPNMGYGLSDAYSKYITTIGVSDSGILTIYTGGQFTGKQMYAQVWYTKP